MSSRWWWARTNINMCRYAVHRLLIHGKNMQLPLHVIQLGEALAIYKYSGYAGSKFKTCICVSRSQSGCVLRWRNSVACKQCRNCILLNVKGVGACLPTSFAGLAGKAGSCLCHVLIAVIDYCREGQNSKLHMAWCAGILKFEQEF